MDTGCKVPENRLKSRYAHSENEPRFGIWLVASSATNAEISAASGADWVLIDTEHGPSGTESVLAQLRAVEPYEAVAVVRPPETNAVEIKRILDLGAQCLLLPMVNTKNEAIEAVLATRYPPLGKRGVGAGVARAARWGRVTEYMAHADEQLLVLVQVETEEALNNLEDIALVEGVDGVFIGPADLSASLGNPPPEELTTIVCEALSTIRSFGKIAGSLSFDTNQAKEFLNAGANFLAVAADSSALVAGLEQSLATFK